MAEVPAFGGRRKSGDEEDGAQEQPEAGQKGAQHQDNTGGFCVHRAALAQPKHATKPARIVSKKTVAP